MVYKFHKTNPCLIWGFSHLILVFLCCFFLFWDNMITSKIISLLGVLGVGGSIIRGFVVFIHLGRPCIEVSSTRLILNTYMGKQIIQIEDVRNITILKDNKIKFYLSQESLETSYFDSCLNLLSGYEYSFNLNCIVDGKVLVKILPTIFDQSRLEILE